ncbi:hypothetical protein KJE20_14289 [Pyrenophora tritici-repentis]|nr:hypothetical protein KJE20_14289 [Pyrenophora tritici-repentis]
MNATKFDMENLNNEDILLLCGYRKLHASIEKQSRSLDFIVAEELVKGLLAQGIERVDITKGLTRLTKLICRHVDTKSLAEGGKILPKLVTTDSNEYRKRASRSPAEPGPGIDARLPSHTISPRQQGPIPISHALRSRQSYHAAETRLNSSKRRRISRNEGLQTLTESDSMQENEETCFMPCPNASRFNAGTGAYDQGDHQTEGTLNTLRSLEHGYEDYLDTTAVELRRQPFLSYISSFQGEQSSYTFRDLEYEPRSSSNASNGVLDQFCSPENEDAMGEASSVPSFGDIREEEDKDDSELPSVVVKDLRIGEQRLGDLDLFTLY